MWPQPTGRPNCARLDVARHNGGVEQADNLNPAMRWGSIVTVWVLAVLAAIAVGIFGDAATFTAWLGLALAGCTVAALCLQLATQSKRGFIDRLGASVSGALVILAVASGILALAHFH